MYTVLIVFRSQTLAQRAARLLEREGCLCMQTRPPAGLGPGRCAYGIRLRPDCLGKARRLLRETNIENGGIFMLRQGQYVPLTGNEGAERS